MDQPSYDNQDNLIGLRIRIYSTSGSVGTDDDVIATYLVSSAGDGMGKFSYWSQIEI